MGEGGEVGGPTTIVMMNTWRISHAREVTGHGRPKCTPTWLNVRNAYRNRSPPFPVRERTCSYARFPICPRPTPFRSPPPPRISSVQPARVCGNVRSLWIRHVVAIIYARGLSERAVQIVVIVVVVIDDKHGRYHCHPRCGRR